MLPQRADRVVQANRMDLADQVKESRADMADLVSRKDLAEQAARKVLVGQAELPWNADQKNRMDTAERVVQANRMDTADQVVQVARKVLAGPARLPSKEVPLTSAEDLRRRSQTSRSISRSSGHEWSGGRRTPRR